MTAWHCDPHRLLLSIRPSDLDPNGARITSIAEDTAREILEGTATTPIATVMAGPPGETLELDRLRWVCGAKRAALAAHKYHAERRRRHPDDYDVEGEEEATAMPTPTASAVLWLERAGWSVQPETGGGPQ